MIDVTNERLLTPQQVADEWQVSLGTVWGWFRAGLQYVEVPSKTKRGRKIRRTSKEAIQRFMRQSDSSPPATRGMTATGKAMKDRHGI